MRSGPDRIPARRSRRGPLAGALALAAAALALGAGGASAQTPNPYNSLTAFWTAPGDDGNVGTVSAYELYYDTKPPGPDTTAWWNAVPFSQRLSLIPPLASAGQADSTHVMGLTQGTTYYFVIVARDEAANSSGFSNVATGTTQSCGAPTSPPSSFSAEVDSPGVLVTWDATTDPAALSVHVYRATGTSLTWSLVGSLAPTATSWQDAQTAPATTYRYRATLAGPDIQGVSCEGPYSAQAIVTTPSRSGAAVVTGSGKVHVYPNPATDRVNVALDVTAPTAIPARLRVYDLNGHWLGTVAEGTYPPGRSLLTWDRSGRTGLRLAPGYYEILGTIGTSRVRERLVLLP
jgi:hypothetical protein